MPVDSCQGTSGFPRLWDTRIPARDEEICPAGCLEPGMQFLPLTNTACKDCNQMHYADICQNVTEIMEFSGNFRLDVTLSNTRAGHPVPTDHPGRHLILPVENSDNRGKAVSFLRPGKSENERILNTFQQLQVSFRPEIPPKNWSWDFISRQECSIVVL